MGRKLVAGVDSSTQSVKVVIRGNKRYLCPMSKVFLFVEVNVKPGKMDEFIEKVKAHGAVIRTEAGCEFLEVYRNTQKEDVLNVWEIWSDRPSWDAHMVNESSKAWQKVAPEYVFGETITVMKNLD